MEEEKREISTSDSDNDKDSDDTSGESRHVKKKTFEETKETKQHRSQDKEEEQKQLKRNYQHCSANAHEMQDEEFIYNISIPTPSDYHTE